MPNKKISEFLKFSLPDATDYFLCNHLDVTKTITFASTQDWVLSTATYIDATSYGRFGTGVAIGGTTSKEKSNNWFTGDTNTIKLWGNRYYDVGAKFCSAGYGGEISFDKTTGKWAISNTALGTSGGALTNIERLTISADGTVTAKAAARVNSNLSVDSNIGIGTTSAGARLHIEGVTANALLKDTSNTTSATIRLGDAATGFYGTWGGYSNGFTAGTFLNVGANGLYMTQDAGGSLALGTRGAGSVILGTNNTERIRITNAGKVGIGTPSPSQDLSIVGTNVGDGGSIGIYDQTLSAYARVKFISNSTGSWLGWVGNVSESNYTDPYDSMKGPGTLSVNQYATAPLAINNRAAYPILFGTADVEKMRITSAGQVGIGTKSPDQKFQVSGGNITVDNGNGYYAKTVSGVDSRLIYMNGSNDVVLGSGTTNNIRFNTGTGGESLTIANGGTVSTAGALTVGGLLTGNANLQLAGNAAITGTLHSNGALSTASTLGVAGNTTLSGTLFVSSTISTNSDIIAFASSDKRLKDNIQHIPNSLDIVSQLNGVSFDWNDQQSLYTGKDYGVIAQEVEEVLPEIVTTRSNGIKAVRYEKLIPVLIEAIKELRNENRKLKNSIQELIK